ncbi:TIGR03643 family protein [Candidatus Marinimicrobia bacterium]|nr:TIGR03643 family protein [bacterium]MDC0881843.1 TIGR03643 family protein [Candidatus Neomarinimicrobiota bacterium]MDG1223661.1 TIGR03643 family protein [Candidatus Neomarinimicrobiota bacterium]
MRKLFDENRVIEMAWEDRTTFDAIKDQYGISEPDVIKLMRKNLKRNSFKLWRERVSGRKTKHRASSQTKTPRFKSYNQK